MLFLYLTLDKVTIGYYDFYEKLDIDAALSHHASFDRRVIGSHCRFQVCTQV